MKKLFLFLSAMILAVPAMLAGNVTFYFQWGESEMEIDNPSYYYNIWNETDEASIELPDDASLMVYEIDGTQILRIEAYDFENEVDIQVVDMEGDENYNLEKEDNQWFLTLFEDTDNIQFYLNLYEAGSAPGSGSGITSVDLTFNVDGVQNAQNNITISYFDNTQDVMEDKTITFTSESAQATVNAGTSIDITPKAGYMISEIFTRSSVVSVSEPAGRTGVWTVYVKENPLEASAILTITVAEASPTATFVFTSTSGIQMPENYVVVSPEDAVMFNSTSNVVDIPADGLDFFISGLNNEDNNYEIASLKITNADGDNVALDACPFVEEGILENTYSFELTSAANGYTFTFDIKEAVITPPSTETYEATINFTSATLSSPWEAVTVTGSSAASVTLNAATNKVEFGENGLSFNIVPKEGYEIASVSIKNEEGEAVSQTSSVMESVGGAYVFTLTEGFNGWTYTLDIAETAPAVESTVTFYITDASDDYSIEDQWEYVSIYNTTKDTPVTLDGAMYEFTYSGVTNLVISSADVELYEVEVAIPEMSLEVFNSTYGELEEVNGTYYLTLNENADGIDFQIYVKPASQGEVEVTEVSLTMTIKGDMQNPNKLLTASYYDKASMKDVAITLNATTVTAMLPVATSVELVPVDGYMLNITPLKSAAAVVSEPQEKDGAWTIYIPEKPTMDVAEVTITVSEAPSYIYLDFVSELEDIYGNPEDYVTVSPLNVFTLKSDSNKIEVPAVGLEFSLAPVEEYAIIDLTITDTDGEEVLLTDLEVIGTTITESKGIYTFNISALTNNIVFTMEIGEDDGTSGINGISVQDGRFTVFTINGNKVMETTNANDLKNLERGLYIINGNKMLIRK